MLERLHTVADVVLDHSECAEVFQRHRIDFCCRGALTLEQAAKAGRLELETLLRELAVAIEARRTEPSADLRALSTPQLVSHILLNHHEPLRRALPFVRALAEKVNRVHGAHNPKLCELKAAVDELDVTLTAHLEEEVHSVFPMLSGQAPARAAVEAMVKDHELVASLFTRIRAASDDFTLPGGACTSYRTLFAELEQLEARTSVRIHLENNVLRPRFARA